MPNLWILTEEKPKSEVICEIVRIVFEKKSFTGFFDTIKIIPMLNDQRHFAFTYRVIGICSNQVDQIFIKVVKGKSSFVDFLIFLQNDEPAQADKPLLIIEETKTTDRESRNTGAGQRASKFPYAKLFYPDAGQIMLYSSTTDENDKPSLTNQFFTRLLITYGVEIIGKELDSSLFAPFACIKEVMDFKDKMSNPRNGNVPIKITKTSNTEISISGRLQKGGRLSHDPSIGQLTIIAAVLRKLGWKGKIKITQHGLTKEMVGKKNKFIYLANLLNITLDGLTVPISNPPSQYWEYEMVGEKMVTIFLDLIVEYLSSGFNIYSNHAGAERGYFLTRTGEQLTVKKFIDKVAYKAGDKSQIINLPDLVICDDDNNQIINIEGEQFKNVKDGIKQLKLFDAFENKYIEEHYPNMPIKRTVVLFGGDKSGLNHVEVSIILTTTGEIHISVKNAPEIFKTATQNLRDFYKPAEG